MRKILLVAMAALAFAGTSGSARSYHHRSHYSHSAYGSSDYYTAASGHRVHRPVYASRAPAGASARCSDGSYSFSESHRGTCSHHGGVSSWL